MGDGIDWQLEPLIRLNPQTGVSSNRLRKMLGNHLWCSHEVPMIIHDCEFRVKTKERTQEREYGYIMVTFGAVYLCQRWGKETPLSVKFHLWDVKSINVTPGGLDFRFKDRNISLKMMNSAKVGHIIRNVVQQCTWCMIGVQTPEIYGSQGVDLSKAGGEKMEVRRRPAYALEKRCLFLAHFYRNKDVRGRDELEAINYFNTWTPKRGSVLAIERKFRPHYFASVFGHAIGWESRLECVVLQNWRSSRMNRLLHSLMLSAQNIERIVFVQYRGYIDAKYFGFVGLSESKVRKFCLKNCDFGFCRGFMRALQTYPGEVDELMITECRFSSYETAIFYETLRKIPALANIKALDLTDMSYKIMFPLCRFNERLSCLKQLRTVSISNVNVDALTILGVLCDLPYGLRVINFRNMEFKTVLKADAILPTTLIGFTMNQCSVKRRAMESVFSWLVKSVDADMKIMFQARNLRLQDIYMEFLSSPAFKKISANIVEFDWSNNTMTEWSTSGLMHFLKRQTNLLILVLDNVDIRMNHEMFLNLVAKMVTPNVQGIDIAGRFDVHAINTFLKEMGKQPQLRRLCVRGCQGGNAVTVTFTETVRKLENLCELGAEGLNCARKSLFFVFWDAVRGDPENMRIRANDFPDEDLTSYGLTKQNMPSHEQVELFRVLHDRKRPATFEKRLRIMLENAEREDCVEAQAPEGDIFMTASMRPLQIPLAGNDLVMQAMNAVGEAAREEDADEPEANDIVDVVQEQVASQKAKEVGLEKSQRRRNREFEYEMERREARRRDVDPGSWEEAKGGRKKRHKRGRSAPHSDANRVTPVDVKGQKGKLIAAWLPRLVCEQ